MAQVHGQLPHTRRIRAETDETGVARVTVRRLTTQPGALAARVTGESVPQRRVELPLHGVFATEEEHEVLDPALLDVEKWSADTEPGDRPLIAHPNPVRLLRDYGGYTKDGEIVFPEINPAGMQRLRSARGQTATDLNPLFGRRDFEDVALVVRCRIVRRGDDWSDYARAGRIYTALPAGAPPLRAPAGHAWRCWVSADVPPKRSVKWPALMRVELEYRSGDYPRALYSEWYG